MADYQAAFEIELTPGEALLPTTGRFSFTKTWTGEINGTSQGLMISGGDPGSGTAGYVALETFTGSLGTSSGGTGSGGERHGSVVFQQFGQMVDGQADLTYAVVPGSGTGDLAGLLGTIDLEVIDGVHRVVLRA